MSARLFNDSSFVAARSRMEENAARCFALFLALVFPQGHSATYRLSRFHLYLADLLQGMADGTESPRQAISAPPQHGKSRMLAVRAVAWLIGAYPGTSIALTGFSRALLVEFLVEVRDIMALPSYRRIFPNIVTRYGMDRADQVQFTNGSSVVVRSAGSKLTGRRADWLIIDDPHAGRAEAESAVQRRKVIQWFFADCVTRLSPSAKILLIGTRWHPHDLIGHLTSDEYAQQLTDEGQEQLVFRKVNLKAISDGENDPLGRQAGEPLAPEIRPLSFLQGMRAALLGYEWDSLFMGTPRSSSSGQVDVNQLRRCNADEVPKGILHTRGWDLAITEKQSSDYTAGARGALDTDTDLFYITNIFRQRMAWARLRATMIRTSLADLEEHGIAEIHVEAVSGFEAVYQEVKDLLAGKVMTRKKNPPKGGKLMRAQPWLAKLEAGKVVMVRGPWNQEFVSELEEFPDANHDDQVDAVSICYEGLTKRGGNLLIA